MDINNYFQNYLSILIFIIISIGLAVVLIILPFLVAKLKPDKEKLSTYECGFENFGNAKKKFDIRFYLVSILFIIFDLEIAFLFPWAVMLKEIGLIGFWSMIAFIVTLTIGFIYEWKKGALEWE
jgi:NADH-quinone oxidoreductase subunit A